MCLVYINTRHKPNKYRGFGYKVMFKTWNGFQSNDNIRSGCVVARKIKIIEEIPIPVLKFLTRR